MKTLMFHMDINTAVQFYERIVQEEFLRGKKLNEQERTNVLIEMANEGLIKTVIGTDRTKEEIVQDSAKHGRVLHLKADGTKEIVE